MSKQYNNIYTAEFFFWGGGERLKAGSQYDMLDPASRAYTFFYATPVMLE